MHTIIRSLPKKAIILALAVFVMLGLSNSAVRAETPAADTIAGKWEGTLTVPNQGEVKLVFEFFFNADGDRRGFLNVPQQSDDSIFIMDVTIDKDAVALSIDQIGIEYSGKLDGNTIDGEFRQGGGTFPLVLEPPSRRRSMKHKARARRLWPRGPRVLSPPLLGFRESLP